MATCQCLQSSRSKEVEKLGSLEKLMLQSTGSDEDQTPLSILIDNMEVERDKSVEKL